VCRQKSSGNIIKNPGIDGATSWDLLGGTTYDATTDLDNCTGTGNSGSLLIPPMLGPSFSQCINTGVAAGASYIFGYLFKGNGQGFCDVGYYSDANCSVYIDGVTTSVTSAGAWMAAQIAAPSPAGTASAKVHCSSVAGDGNYDRFYLSTAGVY